MVGTADNHENETQLRVILVGRTGLEQSVRRTPSIELIRTRDGLDAIAEHGLPMAGGPDRTLVVVSSDVEREEDAAEIVRAMRRVNPKVKVVTVRGNHAGADDGPRAPTDGTIDPRADGSLLLRLMDDLESGGDGSALTMLVEPRPIAAGASLSLPSHEPAGEDALPSVTPHLEALPAATDQTQLGDVPILRVLLAGADILPVCIEQLQAGAPGLDLAFHVASKDEPRPTPAEHCRLISVAHRDRVFGWIEAPSDADEPFIAQRAEWLGHWMAVREQHRQLCSAAFTDALTGAWNRRYCERFLESAMREAIAARQSLTLLIFDIDDFKHYNDNYGHAAGDEILIETVRLLRATVRPNDKVCRIGGDEFAVIFYEPEGPREVGSRHPTSIHAIASRFQEAIAGARFPKLGLEARGTLTISGGLVTFPWDGHSVDTLLSRGDELLLESKRQGKNVICYGPDATPTIREHDPEHHPNG